MAIQSRLTHDQQQGCDFENKNGEEKILMAYVNVAEWSADQSADWLRGLDEVILQYIPAFLSNKVQGQQLLKLRSDDLENIGVSKIGHQELILEAVGQLRNFHYELDRENLQYLALKLSCAATSLYRELLNHHDSSQVETQTLSDVTNVIAMVKPLALWLDRSPFSGQLNYTDIKSELLRLSIQMATSGQRDRFAESPLLAIRDSCKDLAILADKIIQDISDPMLLQPASLDLATLKKREQEMGFDILPSVSGIHQIVDIKFGSPAHSSGKIEDGDEIVQVNYQTVVGWQPKEVLLLCQDSPPEVLLTLKKRPRHTHTFGQIYMKPYRLPSRNRCMPYNRWGSLPSPRPELLAIRDFEMPLPRPLPVPLPAVQLDLEVCSSSDESETSRPGSPTSDHVSSQPRIYLPKPRSVVQRRNTTSGSSPVSKRPNTSIEQFWRELKNHKSLKHSGSAQMSRTNDSDDISDNLYRRDKSVSYSTGLELSPRPKTCLGVGLNHSKVIKLKDKSEAIDQKISSKTVKFHDELVTVNSEYRDEPLPKETKDRGRLDKSHSTPAYDFGESEDSEFPLMKEMIPESPTSSIDSPSIVIHSPEKVNQMLDSKKLSNQIAGAMINNNTKDKKCVTAEITDENKLGNIFGEKHINKSTFHDSQVLETINIAFLEHRKKEAAALKNPCNGQSIFHTEFGEHNSKKAEQIQIISNELLEAINGQRKVSTEKVFQFNSKSIPDVPPEPPPRPLSTQKPGYTPSKPLKHIQKEDIQVIPNTSLPVPITPQRTDICLPLEGSSPDPKHSGSDMSPRSLQGVEAEMKASTPNLSSTKLDTSSPSLKANDSAKLSVSPANSLVRGLLATGKSKSLKKKNSILAKRRKISVKELGSCDMEGYLYHRCRSKNSSIANWHLKWFILLGNTFYGFKNKYSTKADCLIFLSGFTVSAALEVKSKQYAFRIYHTGTVFYFASDSVEAMTMWVECITRATLTNNDSWERASKKDKKTDESKHFSETDYSDDDNSSLVQNEKSKSDKHEKSEKSHKFGSLKKFTNRIHKSDSQENVTHSSSTSLDRKYFNRFFSSKGSKSKEEKSKLKSNDVPVPTDRYRSYRKIPLSDASVSDTSLTTLAQGEHSQNTAKSKKMECTGSDKHISEDDNLPDLTQRHLKKANPINFMHASNPNLLDFEKSDFVTKPKSNVPFPKNLVPRPDNFIGFVTLEQFMLNKQEEERRQVYSNRVLMGVERDIREEDQNKLRKERTLRDNNNLQKQLDKIVPDVIYGEIPNFLEKNITPTKIEQIQNRSLPKAPAVSRLTGLKSTDHSLPTQDVSSRSKPTTEPKAEKLRNENIFSKSGSKKKNDGYETIKYDEMDLHSADFKFEVHPTIPPIIPKKPALKTFKHGYEKITPNSNKVTPGETAPELKLYDYKPKKCSKDLGYECIYDGEIPSLVMPTDSLKPVIKNDLGYEMIYLDNDLDLESEESGSSVKLPIELRKLITSPKTNKKPKKPISRQGSITSVGDRKSSGIDTKPVFKQGDCPEKFWLDSLRRNDKVYSAKLNDHVTSSSIKADKFYTKHSEPSTYMKSSEATIVKSDKLQNKTCIVTDHKPLKSATQYTPMSLQLVTPNKALKTSPQFELSLDTRKSPTTTLGISRLRQMWNQNSLTGSKSLGVKEKSILGSPRLHRALFRKAQPPSSADEWTQDFVYAKGSPSASYSDISGNESYLLSMPSGGGGAGPDYPHLEYPPVFEPETYSLAEPGPSKLRKHQYDSGEK